jgi:hypothetical protein
MDQEPSNFSEQSSSKIPIRRRYEDAFSSGDENDDEDIVHIVPEPTTVVVQEEEHKNSIKK